ncbi:MAG: polysaccharide deacetylase family protein, partial [Terriglobales bacterium]
RALTQLAPPALAQQLCTARHRLQEGAGTPVQFLAAPYGLWDQRVLEAARQAGFSALATSHPGLAAPGAACLARNGIRARTSARQLQRWLCRPASLVWPISRDYLLWTPKHILMHCPRLRDRITPAPVGQRSTSPY